MVFALKLPVLKTGEYNLWSMRMEQYLTFTDHALWEVIVNGDSVSPVTSASAEGPIPPKTAKQKLVRKNELKAKSILMLAILDEHLLKFDAFKDAKSLWEAIKNRFGGNKESKKMQKIILKQNYKNFTASSQEGLDKTYDRFHKIISQLEIHDTLSMDDLYNNLKVYESEIKGQSSLSSNSQNVAFVSLDNSSSTNETVNNAHSVFAASSKDQASTASYADDIDADDLEEMDLKWQVAMLTMKVKRIGHFARECMALKNQGIRNRDAPRRNAPEDISTTNALVVQDMIDKTGHGYDGQINESDLNDIHVNESKVLDNVFDSVFDSHDSDGDDNQVNDRFKKGEGYHAVPPSYTGNYMPLRADLFFAGLDDSVFKSKVSETVTSVPKIETNASKTSKDSLEKPKTVRNTTIENESKAKKPKKFSQSPRGNKRNWNGLMTQRLKDGFKFKKKACFVCGSFNHLIKDCDFYKNKIVLNNKGKITGPKEIRLVWDNTARVNHQRKLTHPHPKRNFVPALVLTKSRQVPVNVAKQSFDRAATSVSVARHVNNAASRPNVNDALPTTYSYFKAHSPGNPQYALQVQGIFDSECSRHMTGNKSYLTDYQEINGGFVAIRENAKGVEGEGSGQPSEPQPPSSTAPPSHEEQVTTVASHPQKTHTPRRTKKGRDTEVPQSSGPPKKVGDEAVYTREDDRVGTGSGSGPMCQYTTLGDADAQTREDCMEHQDDLTDFIPLTPHDSPLSGGHTPGSDEGMNLFKIGTSRRQSLDKENVSKQERNLKTRPMFEEGDFDDDFDDMVDEAIENVEGDTINDGGVVNTATTGVSDASASVTIAGVSISTVEPRKPPTTTTTTFKDEDLTIAQRLVMIRSEKAKEKGVAFRDAEESARPTTILPTINPKDKGKGIMQELEKPPKNPRKDQI
nr:ribonuclease H-like domain-containing protein [Tanacetum cinerariifolium]